MSRHILITAAALLTFAGCETDRTNDTQSTRTTTTTTTTSSDATRTDTVSRSRALSEMDRTFIQEASSGNYFEIESAQLAVDRNTDPQIKQMAGMIVQDHKKANDELRQIATRQGVSFPKRMSVRHQKMLDELRDLQGTEFARQFQNTQEKAHEEAITLFDRQAREGQNPELKSFAQRTLPTLRKHLDHVQQYRVPTTTPPGEPATTPPLRP